MVTKILNYPITQFSISALIVLGATLCIFTPNYYLFINGSHFLMQIMLGYLLLGFVFLIFKQPKLTFTSFACCAILCLYLKENTNADLHIPVVTEETILNVAHFNLSESSMKHEEIIEHIKSSDADIISIQELTPDWLPIIKKELSMIYPYHSNIVRVDPYGLAILSKHTITQLDTFYYENIPNLIGKVHKKDQTPIRFIAGHTTPPLFKKAYEKMQAHLGLITTQANKTEDPLIVLGDFYAPPWCSDIQLLKKEANLNDSRRSVRLSISDILETPVDYILHSEDINCVGFTDIINEQKEHIGIQGAYQLRKIE